MIIGDCGLMGAGKSYYAVNFQIMPALHRGRKVITNIPLNVEYICSAYGDHYRDLIVVLEPVLDENGDVTNVPFSKFDHFKDDWRDERTNQGALFVIDEAQIPLPARESELNKQVLAYATMQRHRGHDWILITQDLALIYQPLVRLITVTHKFEKTTNVGDMKRFRHIVYDGSSVNRTFRLSHKTRKYDPKLFSHYKSHTESDGSVHESNISGASYNLKLLIFGLVCLLLFAIGMIIYYANFISNRYSVDQSDSIVSFDLIVNTAVSDGVGASDVVHKPVSKSNSDVIHVVKDVVKTVHNKIDLERTIHQVKKAPYSDFSFNIHGTMQNKKRGIDVYYQVWSPDGVSQSISKRSLETLGYSVSILDDCTHLLDHQYSEYSFYVTCHVPIFGKEDKEGKDKPNESMSSNVANRS